MYTYIYNCPSRDKPIGKIQVGLLANGKLFIDISD